MAIRYFNRIFILFLFTLLSQYTWGQITIKTHEVTLDTKLHETSGLVIYNGLYITHNDSGGKPLLYTIDSTSGLVTQIIPTGIWRNRDWEEVSCDNNNLYVGDIGNNAGVRTDLKIYTLSKPDMSLGAAQNKPIDSVHFVLEDQKEFERLFYKTQYDCEAFFVHNKTAYLFSKDWKNNQTVFYKLEMGKTKDTARVLTTLDVDCLITGADYLPESQLIVCSAYKKGFPIKPVLVFLKFDASTNTVQSLIRYRLKEKNRQVEAIAWQNEETICITNERYHKTPAFISWYNVSDFTQISIKDKSSQSFVLNFPNNTKGRYVIRDKSGKRLCSARIKKNKSPITIIKPASAYKLYFKTKTSKGWIKI